MLKTRLIRIAVASVVALALGAGIAWWQLDQQRTARQVGSAGSSLAVTPGVPIGGPFTLTDHTGETVTEADFHGRLMLVYFGFSSCPDFCPTDLSIIAQAVDELGPAGEAVVPVFVSVDPNRDTPEVLASYVGLFHPRMVGLTGSDEQIAAVADAYRVYYARVPSDDPDFYAVDHTTFTYLMGPDGSNLLMFPHGTHPERMAEAVAQHLPATGS